MATVRMSLEQAAATGRADLAKIDATTDDDIARHHIEDSLELDGANPVPAEVMEPAEIRRRLGMTQAQLAERLDIPLRTWRNWEQGRVALEPTVRGFLKLLAADPEDVLRKLSGFRLAPGMAGHLNRLARETDDEVMARAREVSTLEPALEEEFTRLRAIERSRTIGGILQSVKAAQG